MREEFILFLEFDTVVAWTLLAFWWDFEELRQCGHGKRG